MPAYGRGVVKVRRKRSGQQAVTPMVSDDTGRADKLLKVQNSLALVLNGITDLQEGLKKCLAAALEVAGMDSGGGLPGGGRRQS